MKTHLIRDQVQKTIAKEKQTKMFDSVLANYFNTQYGRVNYSQINDIKKAVQLYIEHVPDLLDEAEKNSKAFGLWNVVSPLLETVQQYFLDPNDLIPDHLGLTGLLDDAYLAHYLLVKISEKYKTKTGKTLMAEDWTMANNNIKILLGSDNALILENQVNTLVDGPNMQSLLQNLIAMTGSMNYSYPDTSFGGLSASQYADLQTNLITSSYSPSW